MNDDLSALANAYLDDEVTLDERARVESDPMLLDEIDRLRAVRALLADVEPQAISIREAQLAGALDAWDRIPTAERTGGRRDATPVGVDAAAVAAAASVSAPRRLDDRRRWSSKWLGAAAAALVVVLAGGVALQVRSSDDDSGTFDAASSDTSLPAEALIAESADDAAADAAGRADAELSDTPDVETGATQLDTGIDQAAPPAEEGLVVLRTGDDLASFAADALDAPESPDVPAATSAPVDEDIAAGDGSTEPCPGVDVVVGPAVYGDVIVVVGIDEGRGLAIAHAATTCNEIARARLP